MGFNAKGLYSGKKASVYEKRKVCRGNWSISYETHHLQLLLALSVNLIPMIQTSKGNLR